MGDGRAGLRLGRSGAVESGGRKRLHADLARACAIFVAQAVQPRRCVRRLRGGGERGKWEDDLGTAYVGLAGLCGGDLSPRTLKVR